MKHVAIKVMFGTYVQSAEDPETTRILLVSVPRASEAFQCVQTFPGIGDQLCPVRGNLSISIRWLDGSRSRALLPVPSDALLGFCPLNFCSLWTRVGSPYGQQVLCSRVLLRRDPSDAYFIYFVSLPCFLVTAFRDRSPARVPATLPVSHRLFSSLLRHQLTFCTCVP